MNVDKDARDMHLFVAIMAFPKERLSFFDVERLLKARNTTSRPPARRPEPTGRRVGPTGRLPAHRVYSSERG